MGLATQVADQSVAAVATALAQSQPIPSGGLPNDIAEAALYLASDGARFVNGHALVVDGGITVGPTGDRQVQVWAPWMAAVGADPMGVQS
jgi:NAD(P)-dependent dehydrogenase (short-subunit alcohol dehydrogenase family)